MAGRSSAESEIARRVDETAAEVVMPESVDDHSPGQGIDGIDDPIRQGFPAISLGLGVVAERGSNLSDTGKRTGAGLDLGRGFGTAAVEDFHGRGLFGFDAVDSGRGAKRFQLVKQIAFLPFQSCDLFGVVDGSGFVLRGDKARVAKEDLVVAVSLGCA